MTGRKRKSPQDSPDGIYSNKSRSRPSAEARVDPTYGQRSAIPGLDDDTAFGEEEDLVYDEDMDALAYLKSVRQEAFGIPNLLVAPKKPSADEHYDIYNDGVGDFRGRYEDGAYLAASEPASEVFQDPSQEADLDRQVAYFDSILSRYKELRSRMAQMPPNEAVQCLGPNHPTQVGPLNQPLTRWWIKRLRDSDPKPAQIACMNKSSVLRLLRLLTQGAILKRGSQVEFGASYWAWSLLAKLPERGELNSEEIGVVRELGKKVVLIGMGLTEVKHWQKGIQDVEAQFEDNLSGEGHAVVNDEEIILEVEEDLYEQYPKQATDTNRATTDSQTTDTSSEAQPVDAQLLKVGGYVEQPVSASSQSLMADTKPAVTAENIEDLSDGAIPPNESYVGDSETLAAMKAQVLDRLKLPKPEINLEPDLSITPESRPSPSQFNTRATVDMIITIAGEIYGQRDLLEFRSEWAHIM